MFSTRRLQTLMAEHPGGESLIAFLRDALFTFTGPQWEQEDDVTYVVFRRESQRHARKDENVNGSKAILDEFEVTSEPGNERGAVARTAKIVSALNLPNARIERLKTAVAETTMNAMEHGNNYQPDKPVRIRILADESELIVAVTDQGGSQAEVEAPVPDLDAKLAGLQSPRGWGLFLIKAMVDDMRVHMAHEEHTVELVIKLKGGDHASKKV